MCRFAAALGLGAALTLAGHGAEESTPPAIPKHWFALVAKRLDRSYRQLTELESALRAELATLPPLPSAQQSERIGCHSTFSTSPIATKWIEVDLGSVQSFEAVVFVPVDVAYGSHPGPGFGFPVRFRVEASDDEKFSDPRLLAAFDDADFSNPGNHPVFIATPRAAGRFIRLSATRLWLRGDRSLLALGEILVFRGPFNIAAGARVALSDAYNNPPAWEPANATDGQSVLGPPMVGEPSPTNGWHAGIARAAEVEKWVQVDLGSALPLDELRLFPARPRDFPARRGFGFPVRFRVELADDPEFTKPISLLDHTRTDFVNPAENPVIIPVREVRAHFVRVTATRLWERSSDFIFAVAELQIYSGGRNVAPDGVVTSLDSIEVGTWSRKALVDGFNSQGRIVELVDWLRGLSRRRAVQVNLASIETEEQRIAADFAATAIRWAAGLLLIASAGLVLWLRHIRSSRRRALEQLRERIAGDLHDEIGSNLGSIALLSQMALQQSGDARDDLAEINRVARETAASMRDIVWLIKPGTKTAEDFVAKLRETAATMLAGMEWSLDAAELSGPLSLEFQRQAVLVFKEGLHNIRSHASAKNVTIRLADTGQEFVLEITDDGAGFETNGGSTGHGLASMRQRASALGGELILDSSPGSGTRLMLRTRMTPQLRASSA